MSRESIIQMNIQRLVPFKDHPFKVVRDCQMIQLIESIETNGILYGRMIEIYLYTSVAPIPFATMTNWEWGQIGTSNAATLMMFVMLPAFLFAMYEKDGMHLEQILHNMIRVKILNPPIRRYETVNLYEMELPKKSFKSKAKKKKKGGTSGGRK